MEAFWKTYSVPQGETLHWEIGPLDLWVRHLPGEWQVVQASADDEALIHRWKLAEPSPFPPDSRFKRFAVDPGRDQDLLTLRPQFPDRSIVSRPASPIEIPSGTQARFYCGIPIWVRLEAVSSSGLVHLTTVPVHDLSRTWFGTPLEGEACYATKSRAIRDFHEAEKLGFRALCPVKIRNASGESLPFERICLRVRHLALYQGADYLWTNTSSVMKRANLGISEVTFGKHPPGEEKDAVLVEPPREPASPHATLLRTFGNLRSITDFR